MNIANVIKDIMDELHTNEETAKALWDSKYNIER